MRLSRKHRRRRPHGRDYRSSAQDAARGEEEAGRGPAAGHSRGARLGRGRARPLPEVRLPRLREEGPRRGRPPEVAVPGAPATFGAGTLGLLARSKLPAAAWMEFAACMADALPLRETAARVGVSLYTAWFMRMRVCEVMGRRLLPARGGVLRDGRHVLPGVDAGQPLPRLVRPGEARPPDRPRRLPRRARRVGVRAVRRQRDRRLLLRAGRRRRGRAGGGARRAEEAAGGLLGGHRPAALLRRLARGRAPRGAPQPRAGDGELPALQAQGVHRALQRGSRTGASSATSTGSAGASSSGAAPAAAASCCSPTRRRGPTCARAS